MSPRGGIRASDADRERIADRLRQATGEGRLLAEELEERLGRALAARTYGELDALVADLPRGAAIRPRRSRRSTAVRQVAIAGAAVAAVVVVLSALVLILTALAAFWMVLVVAWLLLGRGRHRYVPRYRSCRRAYGPRRLI